MKTDSSSRMKLPKQTTATITDKPGLDMALLKDIVKLCVKSGIKSLKWRDLEVDFGEQINSNGDQQLPLKTARARPVKAITVEQHQLQNRLRLEEDELIFREQQIADLQLTDPLKAEEMIVNGELDDTGDDDSDAGPGDGE